MEGLKDARTLIRNVLPGLAFMLEFLVFASLSGLLNKETWDKSWSTLTSKDSSAIVIGAVTLFFASGAVGYVLANIYHAILNTIPNRWFRFFDYSLVLKDLTASGHLRVTQLGETPITFDRSDFQRDWVILTALWHERRETNQQIKAATSRAESLFDTAHGAGTLLVGSFVAWLIAMLWGVANSWSFCHFLLGLVGFLLVVIHWESFRWTASLARGFVATIVRDQVRYDSGKDGRPVLVFYSGK